MPAKRRRWSPNAEYTSRYRKLVPIVLQRDGYRCQMRDPACCIGIATTADHIIPRQLGGLDTLDNLRAACHPCNSRAGAKLGHRLSIARSRHPFFAVNG